MSISCIYTDFQRSKLIRYRFKPNFVIHVNSLLDNAKLQAMVTSHTPLHHLTNITKLLQYNIESLHVSEYLVAPKVLLLFLISSLLKTKCIYKKDFFVEKNEGK